MPEQEAIAQAVRDAKEMTDRNAPQGDVDAHERRDRVTARMPGDLAVELRVAAARRRQSISRVVEAAVREFLARPGNAGADLRASWRKPRPSAARRT